jgi:hypothetical protein
MKTDLDNGATFWGFFFGLVIGTILTLMRGPRLTLPDPQEVRQEIRDKIDAITPGDPITESIAEGKAAARRRLAELNQPPNPPESS